MKRLIIKFWKDIEPLKWKLGYRKIFCFTGFLCNESKTDYEQGKCHVTFKFDVLHLTTKNGLLEDTQVFQIFNVTDGTLKSYGHDLCEMKKL